MNFKKTCKAGVFSSVRKQAIPKIEVEIFQCQKVNVRNFLFAPLYLPYQGRIGTYYFVILCLSQHLFSANPISR